MHGIAVYKSIVTLDCNMTKHYLFPNHLLQTMEGIELSIVKYAHMTTVNRFLPSVGATSCPVVLRKD